MVALSSKSRGFHVRFYPMKQSLTPTTSFFMFWKLLLLKRQEPLLKASVTKRNRSSYVQVTIITVENQSAWDVQSHSWHVKVLDSVLFRGSYVREFELSHCNLVNRIIKITHAHNLNVKLLDFAPFKICTWKNAYCLRDYFAQTILTNHLFF